MLHGQGDETSTRQGDETRGRRGEHWGDEMSERWGDETSERWGDETSDRWGDETNAWTRRVVIEVTRWVLLMVIVRLMIRTSLDESSSRFGIVVQRVLRDRSNVGRTSVDVRALSNVTWKQESVRT